MFDEVCLRVNLGCKILAGQLVVGQFGPEQTSSLVAISQTLDKLVVHELDTTINYDHRLFAAADSTRSDSLGNCYYISVKDVIKSISIKCLHTSLPVLPPDEAASRLSRTTARDAIESATTTGRKQLSPVENELPAGFNPLASPKRAFNLLLIGCASSLLIYNVYNQSNLLNILMPSAINSIAAPPRNSSNDLVSHHHLKLSQISQKVADNPGQLPPTDDLTICASSQKIYAIKFESKLFASNGLFDAEISSERSTGETITCMCMGRLREFTFVITGSIEQRIKLFQVDTFEQNVSTCNLTIEENSSINCLQSIDTLVATNQQQVPPQTSHLPRTNSRTGSANNTKSLPSVVGQEKLASLAIDDDDINMMMTAASGDEDPGRQHLQTNYFAYGLENGFIGVHRLLLSNRTSGGKSMDEEPASRMLSERLWRHKTKHTPLIMVMFDINGDGYDELVIGYKNSRLEARSPFTGQLLATTKCFKADRLAGLSVLDCDWPSGGAGLMLLACSTTGQLAGFKPKFSKPRQPLQGYNATPVGGKEAALRDYLASDELWLQSSLSNAKNAHGGGGGELAGVSNLKTIENDQQNQDIFMKESASAADLHIETQSDDTRPTKCDARQNFELLQRLNALYCEQLELERKACHMYQRNVGQSSKLYPTDLNITYRWDLDESAVHLRLTITVDTNLENIRLARLEDETRNYLSNGYLFANLDEPSDGAEQQAPSTGKSRVLVFALNCEKNIAAMLNLKVFCESLYPAAKRSASPRKLARVFSRTIAVPKYSMFALAKFELASDKSGPDAATGGNSNQSRLIRLQYQLIERSKIMQVTDWLAENFLCFQFMSSLRHYKQSSNSRQIHSSGEPPLANLIFQTTSGSDGNDKISRGDFDLEVIDLRMARDPVDALERRPGLNLGSKNEEEEEGEERDQSERQRQADWTHGKFAKLSSTLRLAVANGALNLESENSDLVVDLVQSLMIDRLNLEPTADKLQRGEVIANVEPLLAELDSVTKDCQQLEESERRIQTELYESADYTKNLMQQLAISNELSEFATSKELLSEVNMMLNGVQNAARAHSLNNKARSKLSSQIEEIKGKISFLSGLSI